MKALLGIIILVILAGGYYVLTQGNPQPENTRADEASTAAPAESENTAGETTAETSAAPSEIKSFTVEGKSYSFSPSVMRVKKGDTVRITFKNTGGFHDFTLNEFNAQTKRINTGQENTIEFVADKAGTFEYYCSVGNHRQLGMTGTLTVTE